MNRFRFEPDHDRAVREFRERPGGNEWGLSIRYRETFLRRLWRMMSGGTR